MPRHLGQHFLISRSAIKKIVTALSLTPGDHVIEIGPGKGALTNPLATACTATGCSVTAIEKDGMLAQELIARFAGAPVHIEIGDALTLLPQLADAQKKPYKLVGNIPYYITGALLRVVSELEHKPRIAIFTIQREVAQRITASAPQMNLLAAITQTWSSPNIIASLKPKDFIPPPAVDSAVLTLIPRANAPRETEKHYELIKILFKQPRKTVRNNLREGIGEVATDALLHRHAVSPTVRPQDLTHSVITELCADFTAHPPAPRT